MSRKFKIIRDYHKEGEFLYQKKHVEFEPGLTVLIGCNGCGKTTLMRQVRLQVEKDLKNPCVVHFDNFADGGHNSMQVSAFHEDFSRVAQQMCSSEGERIAIDMEMVARKIGNMMHKYQNEKEFWIFLDGIDSGFSIDAIEDLKRGLFDTIFLHIRIRIFISLLQQMNMKWRAEKSVLMLWDADMLVLNLMRDTETLF